jgi:hypothetical protein
MALNFALSEWTARGNERLIISIRYEKHPDYEDAKQIIQDKDTREEVSPESLIGKRIKDIRMEKGDVLIVLED